MCMNVRVCHSAHMDVRRQFMVLFLISPLSWGRVYICWMAYKLLVLFLLLTPISPIPMHNTTYTYTHMYLGSFSPSRVSTSDFKITLGALTKHHPNSLYS